MHADYVTWSLENLVCPLDQCDKQKEKSPRE